MSRLPEEATPGLCRGRRTAKPVRDRRAEAARSRPRKAGVLGRPAVRSGLLAAGAVAAILGLDAVAVARTWPVPVQGLLDEPAHVLTAWLCLVALGAPLVPGRQECWALAAAVVIDLDHVPLYLDRWEWAVDGSRPPTHSLALVLLLAAAAVLRPNATAAGLALGVLLHLARDLATGPGVALFWPVGGPVTVPYAAYLVGLLLAAAGVMASRRSGRRSGLLAGTWTLPAARTAWVSRHR